MARLHVQIVEARDLIAADSGGTSDPYVVAKLLDFTGRPVAHEEHKTSKKKKTLSPVWNEQAVFGEFYNVANENAPPSVELKVFDHNKLSQDKPLGIVEISLESIDPENGLDAWFPLERFGNMRNVSGEIHVVCSMTNPSSSSGGGGGGGGDESKDGFDITGIIPEDDPDFEEENPNELHIIVLRARNLQIMDRNLFGGGGSSDPLVVVKCGKHKNKTVTKHETLTPEWNEHFYFPMWSDSESIEITVEDYDRTVNDFMGRVLIPLYPLTTKELVRKWYKLGNDSGTVDEENRGEVELAIRWAFNPSVVRPEGGVFSKLIGDESSEAEEDEDDMFADEKQGEEEKDEEAAQREKEEKEAAEKALKEELGAIEVKSGDYQVQVHIIECRDLKAEDVTGLSDPVVYIDCMGERQNTEVKEQCLSCVFDELFIFNFRNKDKDEIEEGLLKISVMDADTFSRNDMIGSVSFDLTYIYFQKDHELHNVWLGLIDDEDEGDDGVQGYLKISVQVVGPGDKLKIHEEEDNVNLGGDEMGMVMMPPTIKKETVWYVVTAHRAEALPQMDAATLGMGGGIDAFYQVYIGNEANKAKTKKKTINGQRAQLNPSWNYELWLPVSIPTMTSKVKHSVWDFDYSGSDMVGMFSTNFSLLRKLPGEQSGPKWIDIYGAPIATSALGDLANAVKTLPGLGQVNPRDLYDKMPEQASTWKGRVLMSERVVTDRPEKYKENDIKPFRRKVKKITARQEPPTRTFLFKCLLISGTNLPPPKLGNQLQIKFSCGLHEIYSKRTEVRKGVCEWYELLEMEPMLLPVDTDQCPDIFVYLCKGKGNDLKPFCFQRFKVADLLERGFTQEAEWIVLKEDKVIDALGEGVFPGTVLAKMGIGTEDDWAESASDWTNAISRMRQRVPYELRCHIYQGRNLPAADSNGLLDPYLVISCLGEEVEMTPQKKTTDPLWYETFTFQLELPDLEFAPQVCVALYDWDQWDANDFLGTFFFPLKHAILTDPNTYDPFEPLPDPTWHTVFFEEEGDSEGDILASFQLFRKTTPDQQIPPHMSIVPDYQQAWLEVIVLGLRDMVPYQFLPLQLPFLEIEVTSGHGKGKEVFTTNTSKKPSGENANYLERLVIPIDLPTNALFASPVKVRAVDTRLGGYVKPVVGNGIIDLVNKIPWSASYVPPQMDGLTEVEVQAGTVVLTQDGEMMMGGGKEEEDDGTAALETKEGEEGEGEEKKVEQPRQEPMRDAQIRMEVMKTEQDRRKYANNKVRNDEGEELDDPIATLPPLSLEDLVKNKMHKHQQETLADSGAGVFGALSHVDLSILDEKKGRKKARKTVEDFFLNDDEEEEEDKPPAYMINRDILSGELEEELVTSPFETYELSLGKKVGAGFTDKFRIVGRMKGLIRVLEREDEEPLFDLHNLLKPQNYKIRLYVLRGIGLTPMDEGWGGRPGKSDPYLKVTLGKEKFDDRENKIDDVTDVDFYKAIELNAELPGASRMVINCMDHDDIGSDDLIGRTVIDLEDRLFDKRYAQWGVNERKTDPQDMRWDVKPLERRGLYIPTNTRPQGTLECWVDIMTPAECNLFPLDDVSLPPTQEFEVRLVIWKTKDVVAMDTLENMNDLFVKAWIEGCDPQETDTHWRCKKGKGSFNWRMKFDVTLGHNTRAMKFPYLYIQMWDKDILKWNDCIAEGVLHLGKYFKRAYKKNAAIKLFSDATNKGAGKKRNKDKERRKKILGFDPDEVPPDDEEDDEEQKLMDGGNGQEGGDIELGESKNLDDEPLINNDGGNNSNSSSTPAPKPAKKTQNKPAEEEGESSGGFFSCFGGDDKPKEEEEQPLVQPQAADEDDLEDMREMINGLKEMTGLWDMQPPDSDWFHMTRRNEETGEHEPMGSLCYSLQIWPKDKANVMAAGSGRSDPNNDPYLPPPTGRLKFSWNPFAMCIELCGPALCMKIMCCLICLGFMFLMIFCQPALNAMIFLLSR